MNAKQIIERVNALKSQRGTWENHWSEVTRYVLPRKEDLDTSSQSGKKKNTHLFDSTALQANELLAGALHGMLTNPSSYWFGLTTADDELDAMDDVRLWLDETARKMHAVLNNSNFQTEIHEVYLDLGSVGTGVLSIEEDDETVVRFASRHISEAYIEESNKGVIDTVFRTFKWTARQIVMEFGEKAVGARILKAYKDNSADQFDLIHAVYLRDGLDPEKVGPKHYKFASKYVLVDGEIELDESGFQEFPYAVPRWTKTTGEINGRSPAMIALPDIKMVNEMMKVVIRGAQKTVDPPLMLPDDGFIAPVKTVPGGLNYYRSGTQDRIETFANDARIDFGYQVVEDVRKRIRSAFYYDILQTPDGPQKTATEVLQRSEENMRIMGPVVGRQHFELLKPLIERLFGIMLRKKQIPEIPEVLSGRRIGVNYISQLAKAQKTSEGENINRVVSAISPFIQLDPSVMDNFDSDEAARFIAGVYGLPQKLMRNVSDRDEMRAARAEAQQQQQQMQMQMQQAEQMSRLAPAAAQAKDAGII